MCRASLLETVTPKKRWSFGRASNVRLPCGRRRRKTVLPGSCAVEAGIGRRAPLPQQRGLFLSKLGLYSFFTPNRCDSEMVQGLTCARSPQSLIVSRWLDALSPPWSRAWPSPGIDSVPRQPLQPLNRISNSRLLSRPITFSASSRNRALYTCD